MATRSWGTHPIRYPEDKSMKAFFAVATVIVLAGTATAEDKKVDPVGTWKCETDVMGQKRESTLTIKKDGDKLSGTIIWQDKKESKVADLKIKDGEMTFSAERELMDMKFTIKYKAKVDGDKIKGKAEVEIGGEAQSFDYEGKREKKDK
jgi:hypothetical protein